MKKIKMYIAILFIGLAVSCEKEKIQTCTTCADTLTKEINYIPIAKGSLYGSSSEGFVEENMIITDSVAWNDFKAHMDVANDVTSGFSETEIDFSLWTVLVSIDKVQPNGGHSIDYSSIVENNAYIIASIFKESPQGNATTVITQPYVIVKIEKSNKTIIFN